jgi:hypothetical protein
MRTLVVLMAIAVFPVYSPAGDEPGPAAKSPAALQPAIRAALEKVTPSVVSIWHGEPPHPALSGSAVQKARSVELIEVDPGLFVAGFQQLRLGPIKVDAVLDFALGRQDFVEHEGRLPISFHARRDDGDLAFAAPGHDWVSDWDS